MMMKRFLSSLLATTLASSFAFASIPAVNAAPVFVPKTAEMTDVQNVQYGPEWRRMHRDRFGARQGRFYARGDSNYYRGYRGYRNYRHGYREYNGWWFPAAAFLTGALITGSIINSERRASGDSHVTWCYDRYRSYRASDNTWKPNYGPRRQCNSPYD